MQAIGFLELNSIAKGVEAADAILKAASTQLLFAKATCPGKYVVLLSGEVAAVTASLDAGAYIGGRYVVDAVVIARIHPQVIHAVHQAVQPVQTGAVGVMEFYSITAAIYGADAAAKSADVTLMDVRLGTGIGGKSFVVLCGDVAAVDEAVKAGIHQAQEHGMVVSSVVIPNPREEIFQSLM